jgi:hypothetical protein
MKTILIVIFSFLVLNFAWRQFLKRLVKKNELQKLEDKIIGAKIVLEIEEIDFLAKHFKGKFLAGWNKRIKEKILLERFEELAKKYNIVIDKK